MSIPDIHVIIQEGPRTAILSNRHLDTRLLQELKEAAEHALKRKVHALRMIHAGNELCVLCFTGFDEVDKLEADPSYAIAVFRDFAKKGMDVIDPDLLASLR